MWPSSGQSSLHASLQRLERDIRRSEDLLAEVIHAQLEQLFSCMTSCLSLRVSISLKRFQCATSFADPMSFATRLSAVSPSFMYTEKDCATAFAKPCSMVLLVKPGWIFIWFTLW